MTTAATALLAAVLAQVALTLAVGIRLAWTRREAIRAGTTHGDVSIDDAGWPRPARLAQRNFANQFEVPVLFYALAFVAMSLAASTPIAVLAWIFVASRIVHAVIHCGVNVLKYRGSAWFVGVLAVIGMLIVDLAALVGVR